ncbi:hypothetical protein [Persicirhabdus sediminis]|nr:hypothetical protein [Persicirhabdus sediminis]
MKEFYFLPDGTGPWETLHDGIGVNGTDVSQYNIYGQGSYFELWCDDTEFSVPHLLDTKLVGPAVPKADIAITTVDPYVGDFRRTREDKGFSYQVTMSGMVVDGSSEEGNHIRPDVVHLIHDFIDWGNSHTVDTNHKTRELKGNGSTATYNEGQLISSGYGEEKVYVRAVLDDGDGEYSNPWIGEEFPEFLVYKRETVRVFPYPYVAFIGITNGETFTYDIPQCQVTVRNAYPDSRVLMKAYMPSQQSTTEKILDQRTNGNYGSTINYTLFSPTEMNKAIDRNGTWTIEVIDYSPISPEGELRSKVTFNVDRRISVNADLHTAQ